MDLYHITDKTYPLEEIDINNYAGDSLYHQGLLNDLKKVNNFLSDYKPVDEPARNKCFYAFEKPELCVYFKKSELKNGHDYHLYKCKMNSSQGHPMIMMNQFMKIPEDKWEILSNEYWHPTQPWKVLEQLSEKMEIIEEIPITELMITSMSMVGMCDYVDDANRVRLLLGSILNNKGR